MSEIPQHHLDFAAGFIARLLCENNKAYSMTPITQELAKICWDRERAIDTLESIAYSSFTKAPSLQDIAVDSLAEIKGP